MINSLALFQCLQPLRAVTALKQFSLIALAMLVMSGRVSMLSMSRWAGTGGSYRTVQRFFYTKAIPWAALFWVFFQRPLHRSDPRYLRAGDEVVVTKAGKETSGLDRFYSSLYGKAVPGLSFFALSLIDLSERGSFPLRIEQSIRTEAEKAASKATKSRGRNPPRKSVRVGVRRAVRTRARRKSNGRPSYCKGRVAAQLKLRAALLPLTYLALEGHFGNNNALCRARQCGLHLISKLRCDSALYLPYTGPYSGHGPPRK
jgi:putative transposase